MLFQFVTISVLCFESCASTANLREKRSPQSQWNLTRHGPYANMEQPVLSLQAPLEYDLPLEVQYYGNPKGRPDDRGPPPGHSRGPPANRGPPSNRGPPANRGPPSNRGPPPNRGPPSNRGPPHNRDPLPNDLQGYLEPNGRPSNNGETDNRPILNQNLQPPKINLSSSYLSSMGIADDRYELDRWSTTEQPVNLHQSNPLLKPLNDKLIQGNTQTPSYHNVVIHNGVPIYQAVPVTPES